VYSFTKKKELNICVDCDYKGSGVSGVVGGVRYAFVGCVGIDGGGGVDFGGDT
jgi:hypothetical protein